MKEVMGWVNINHQEIDRDACHIRTGETREDKDPSS
jgi:hypothetical protein